MSVDVRFDALLHARTESGGNDHSSGMNLVMAEPTIHYQACYAYNDTRNLQANCALRFPFTLWTVLHEAGPMPVSGPTTQL